MKHKNEITQDEKCIFPYIPSELIALFSKFDRIRVKSKQIIDVFI